MARPRHRRTSERGRQLAAGTATPVRPSEHVDGDIVRRNADARAIWGFWGPDSARATRENDRSWSPPAEFIEEGQAYIAAVDLDEKREHFRRMVEIWETEQPALMLWRNIANWVIDEDIDWTSINSNWMLLGPGYLSFEAD